MPRFPLEGSGSEDLLPFTPRALDSPADPEELRSRLTQSELCSWLPVPCPSVLARGLPRLLLPLLLCRGAQGWPVGGLAVDRPANSTAAAAVPAGESASGPQAARSWRGVLEPVGAHPLELPPFWALSIQMLVSLVLRRSHTRLDARFLYHNVRVLTSLCVTDKIFIKQNFVYKILFPCGII